MDADLGDRAGQLHGRVALRRLEHALQHGGCLLVLANRVHVVQVDRVVQEATFMVREVLQAEEEEAVAVPPRSAHGRGVAWCPHRCRRGRGVIMDLKVGAALTSRSTGPN